MACSSEDLDAMLREAGDWNQSMGFVGDYYRDHEDVLRGFPLMQSGFDECSSAPLMIDANYYEETDDVMKGLPLSASRPSDSYLPCYDFQDQFYMDDKKIEHELVCESTVRRSCSDRFSSTDEPPCVPEADYGELEETTLHIGDSLAFEVANLILVFLGTLTVSINKVRRAKYWIKADVFIGNDMCTIKIRFYKDSSTTVVEFQRRSGTCLTFRSIYQKASHFLLKRYPTMLNAPTTTDEPVAPRFPDSNIGAEELSPYFDMAGMVDQPSLQAEAAAALAEMANTAQAARSICTSKAFITEFKKLLQSNDLETAVPTSRLLLLIAQQKEAAPCFTDKELLEAVLNQVQSKSTHTLVCEQLSQAFSAAMARFAAILPEDTSRAVLHKLDSTITSVDLADVHTIRNLKDAHDVLRRHNVSLGHGLCAVGGTW